MHILKELWLRKALGAPADSDVCGTGFLHSVSHAIEILRFYWSAGVRLTAAEAPVTSGFVVATPARDSCGNAELEGTIAASGNDPDQGIPLTPGALFRGHAIALP